MAKLKRIMVGLDFTEIDKTVIKYTEFISKLVEPEKIYFIHFQQSLDIPDEVKQEIYDNSQPFDEILREEMISSVKEHFSSYENFEIEYLVAEGSRLGQALHWSKIKETDLFILGRKKEKISGVFLTRFTRRSRCSVLIVPQKAELNLENILLCNDYSNNSELAFERILNMANLVPGVTIYSQHIYAVPTGYHKSGKSFDTIAGIMKNHSKKRHSEFLEKFPDIKAQVIPLYTLDKNEQPAKLINKTAESLQANLIVLGAKGMSYTSSLFLGSFAERLIRLQTDAPVLVVKSKDQVFGVFEAIKNL
ncbi:universal stress protein [Flexithrix dorotheae]|uniref:universal stress protein n=1 Tax=Flexithrix dorotheae TaxID=70993 RepID=UPI00035EFC9C|nr:universal stress protein [Flexithrix dorotheae]